MPTLASTEARYKHATRSAMQQAREVRQEIVTKRALQRLERVVREAIEARRRCHRQPTRS